MLQSRSIRAGAGDSAVCRWQGTEAGRQRLWIAAFLVHASADRDIRGAARMPSRGATNSLATRKSPR
jgi:hypothetical protein